MKEILEVLKTQLAEELAAMGTPYPITLKFTETAKPPSVAILLQAYRAEKSSLPTECLTVIVVCLEHFDTLGAVTRNVTMALSNIVPHMETASFQVFNLRIEDFPEFEDTLKENFISTMRLEIEFAEKR